MTAAPPPGLHRFARFTAAAVFLLIIAGASVTSTGSALAVPDWPLSYGQVFPAMKGGVFFEHGHRLLAAAVGVLTMVLAGWTIKAWPGRAAKRLAAAAAGAVVLQGLLGGITVLYRLPKPVSISHACLGQTFFCIVVLVALFTSPGWTAPVQPAENPDRIPVLKVLTSLTAALAYLQLILGASFRHSALTILPHLFGAGAVSVAAVGTAAYVFTYFAEESALKLPALALMAVLSAQLALGLRTLFSWGPIPATAHVACGALLLVLSVLLTAQAWRLGTVESAGQEASA